MAPKTKKTLPTGVVIAVALLIVIVLLIQQIQEQPSTTTLEPGDYLICFWNVENLFDDVDDEKRNETDDPYDNWFSQNKEDLQLKLERLTSVLLALNGGGGPGPDIIALAEVESERAAELVKDALNAKIPEAEQHYKHVFVKEVSLGRHIAPAIITRLPVVADRTKQLGRSKQRIIEVHIQPKNGPQLVLIASHWTSRRSGGEKGRKEYADDIYGRFKAIWKQNPAIDLLVCGDFNDTPDDESVTEHLRAIGNLDLVRSGDAAGPFLFNLMAGKNPKDFGTYYYGGWNIYDQIAISPGLLDKAGWNCDPNSLRTIRIVKDSSGREIDLRDPKGKIRRPYRFGDQTDDPKRRGFSDHFPISAVLTLDQETKVARR